MGHRFRSGQPMTNERCASPLGTRVFGSNRATDAGLRLSICKGIVQAHGGQILVVSTVYRGTIFYFTVPIAER
jgi:signal transduction histidine kinase